MGKGELNPFPRALVVGLQFGRELALKVGGQDFGAVVNENEILRKGGKQRKEKKRVENFHFLVVLMAVLMAASSLWNIVKQVSRKGEMSFS